MVKHQCPEGMQPICGFRFDSIDETLKTIDTRLAKIEEVLIVGNGVPPLKQRVATLEEESKTRKEETKESRGRKWAIAGLIIAACLAVIVPKLILLLKYVATLL